MRLAERIRARSSAKAAILLTRTPTAGSISYRVIIGPGETLTTLPFTPKVSSAFSSNWAFSAISSLVTESLDSGGNSSKSIGGS